MAVTPEQLVLARHRLERAEETLNEAKDELAQKNYRLAVNRAYYAVFYVMKAFMATKGVDSSKHSGVISLFNQHFIRVGIVPEIRSKAIQSLMDLRQEGDYQDFFEVSPAEARGAVGTAATIVESLSKNLRRRLSEQSNIAGSNNRQEIEQP